MVHGKKVAVVLPAYNAEATLSRTVAEIPQDLVDYILVVDDNSRDNTAAVARELGLSLIVHDRNKGYGGNQKTCYQEALNQGADIVIMLHPDYQYTPLLIPVMAHMLATGLYDVVLGSRILGGQALQGGMPLYKYVANRFLTAAQNLLQGAKLSEYHTGYRGYTRQVLETLPWKLNSDDFVFDNQFLAQTLFARFRVGEISCPTKYFEEASSINFSRSVKYGLGCLSVASLFFLNRIGALRSTLFQGLKR
ncbi:MAG: glycosyltransferase family 2 protein [Bdellovibrionales bacterium]